MNDTDTTATRKVSVVYPVEHILTFEVDKFSCGSTTSLLETMFEWCNHGSGKEHPDFINAKVRSMCPGDFVQIDSDWYQCLSIGWRSVSSQFVSDVLLKIGSLMILNPTISAYEALTELRFSEKWPYSGSVENPEEMTIAE